MSTILETQHFEPENDAVAIEFLMNVFQEAGQEILIADKYLDQTILDMLEWIPASVKIRLLTGPSRTKSGFANLLRDHGQSNVACRIDETGLFEKYVVIDNTHLYVLSVSFNAINKQGISIEKLEDAETVATLKNLWSNGVQLR
jgi:sugar-specific transcriptional regulator TrmB